MPPTGSCTVCAHPSQTVIDQDLQRGMTAGQVARTYTLSVSAVQRHVAGGHVSTPGAPSEGNQNGEVIVIPPDASPRERLQVLITALEQRITTGRARTDDFRELRIAYKDLDQLSGGAAPTVVTIDQIVGWREFLKDFWETMKTHPEARRAFAELARRHQIGVPRAAESAEKAPKRGRGKKDNGETRSGAVITSPDDTEGQVAPTRDQAAPGEQSPRERKLTRAEKSAINKAKWAQRNAGSGE